MAQQWLADYVCLDHRASVSCNQSTLQHGPCHSSSLLDSKYHLCHPASNTSTRGIPQHNPAVQTTSGDLCDLTRILAFVSLDPRNSILMSGIPLSTFVDVASANRYS